MNLKVYLILSMVVFNTFSGFAQSTKGAICISEKGDEPHSSAMLQISSNQKGVLFPRMSFEAAIKIENKKDGLIVFVTDSAKYGYWYWNAKDAKWIQVRAEGTEGQDTEAPQRGIIMYSGEVSSKFFNPDGSGKTGTKMEGWQICNGANNSPNLTGRFIMGAITTKQEFGGTDSIRLNTGNMPAHKHGTNTVNGSIKEHTHTISEQRHTHSMTVIWKKINGFKRHDHIEVRNGGKKVMRTLPQATDVQSGNSEEIMTLDQPGMLTFDTNALNSRIVVKNSGQSKPIENRPSFYVLIYIMRTSSDQ